MYTYIYIYILVVLYWRLLVSIPFSLAHLVDLLCTTDGMGTYISRKLLWKKKQGRCSTDIPCDNCGKC